MLSMTLHVEGLDELLVGLNGASAVLLAETKVATEKGTAVLEAEIKADTPRRSGHLFSSIQGRVRELGGISEGRVGTSLSYGPFVEFNTVAHAIEAKNGKALMLPIGGAGGSIFGGATLTGRPRSGQQVAFFRRVQHPGTTGKHMFGAGLHRARPVIEEFFREAVRTTLKSIGWRTSNIASHL